MGAEFGDDRASASDSSVSRTRLSSVDRAERNSRALSLHNSITKSMYFSILADSFLYLHDEKQLKIKCV